MADDEITDNEIASLRAALAAAHSTIETTRALFMKARASRDRAIRLLAEAHDALEPFAAVLPAVEAFVAARVAAANDVSTTMPMRHFRLRHFQRAQAFLEAVRLEYVSSSPLGVEKAEQGGSDNG
jgi:hypothetical protein